MGEEIMKFIKKSGKMEMIFIWKSGSELWWSMSWCGFFKLAVAGEKCKKIGQRIYVAFWHAVNQAII